MNLQNILANWKTSLGGVILLVLAVLQMVGVTIPGLPHFDFGTQLVALIGGVMGIVAKDSTVTGGSKPNA